MFGKIPEKARDNFKKARRELGRVAARADATQTGVQGAAALGEGESGTRWIFFPPACLKGTR